MFLKINENTYIAISTITKIKIVKDIDSQYIRIFANGNQHDIAKTSKEYTIALKFVEQNSNEPSLENIVHHYDAKLLGLQKQIVTVEERIYKIINEGGKYDVR